MNRKNFITTSAGFLAFMTVPGCYLIQNKEKKSLKKFKFRNFREDTSYGKIKIVTPDDGYYIQTFFDVCPFSPGQKYLAVSKLPYQDRDAKYGDTTDICVIDLENETIETVYSTRGWGFQLGANLNWGKSDRYLYTNDIIENEPVCVRIDLKTGETKGFAGPMYHIAPDESAVVGFPLDLINITQMGYGVPYFREFEEIKGAPADQGLWQTNLKTNQKKLLVSLNDALNKSDDPGFYEGAGCYFFHSKYNLQGTRIFQVMRGIFPDPIVASDPSKRGRNPMLFTFNADGTDIHQSVTREQWSLRGNHPNWHPDGEHIIMNLTPAWMGETRMLFCMFHHTGKDFKILSDKFSGSGHPSVNPDTSWLISDYYVGEYRKLNFEESPIRLINIGTQEELHICTVPTDIDISDSTLRVDPHVVWSRDYKKVCFNGAPDGKRQVFVADLTGVI